MREDGANGHAPDPIDTETEEYLQPSRSASAARHDVAPRDRRMRARRALKEFLWVPAFALGAHLLLAVAVVVVDRSEPGWAEPLRRPLESLITHGSGTTLLSGIATSVVTVTSITFSVLLLAVQQSAASLTPVVFDQFLRRRVNQVYLGMFVGLSVYAFVVLLSTDAKHAPVFGAAIALVLTVCAFLALVVLIYSTIDQMRPTSIVQAIHDRALSARAHALRDIRRTRRCSEHGAPVRVTVRAEQDGYVTCIDLDRIAGAIPDGPAAEVTLLVTLGDHIALGDPLAEVKDDEEARAQQVADALRDALQLDRERDLDGDASFAVSELANIAWTAFSSAKHNPQAGCDAVDRMRDLGARWCAEEREHAPASHHDVLPIVYEDRDIDTLLDSMLATLASTIESQQHEGAAHVVDALASVVRVAPEEANCEIDAAFARQIAPLERLPRSRRMQRAIDRLQAMLRESGLDAAAAVTAHAQRVAATPDPSYGPSGLPDQRHASRGARSHASAPR